MRRAPPCEPELVGRSLPILELHARVRAVAESDAPIVLLGETGTGKELVARLIHFTSARRPFAFVAVNCAAFPETLLEGELFGHERGAFTGAVRRREGRFKAADGGTLLLDEVAEIPLQAQVKLLRVLEEHCIEPLGSDRPLPVDVRVLSATHRDLKQRVHDGLFREDLYYRLNVISLTVPPLRERDGDVPLLVEHFLDRRGAAGRARQLSPRAWRVLSRHAFPGNVRELAHAVEHAFLLARGGEIDVGHLPPDILASAAIDEGSANGGVVAPLAQALQEFEREYVLRALRSCGGKRAQAAALLGLSRQTLWEKMRAYGLGPQEITATRAECTSHPPDSTDRDCIGAERGTLLLRLRTPNRT